MPGEFPTAGYENPYKASSLDPRVDGGKPRPAGEASNLSSQGRTKHDLTGTSGATGVGAGAAVAGASQAFSGSSASPRHDTAETAPSTLNTTEDPASRSAEYGQSTTTKGFDAATTSPTTGTTSSQPGAASTTSTHPQTGNENQGMMSKVLGAVGLGGAGAAAASALGYGGKTETQDELRDTSAIAGQPGQTSNQTGPPKHYRRESIPTTAYPAGPGSPPAVAPPVGGAHVPASQAHSQDTHSGRDAALGAGLGGGALAASRHDEQQGLRQNIPDVPSSTAHPDSALGQGASSSGAPLSGDSTTHPQTRSTVHDLITTGSPQHDNHADRDAGLATTAVAAGVGAGAYGMHEHNKDRGTSSDAKTSTATGSTGFPGGSRDTTLPPSATGPSVLPDRTRDTPMDAVAAAPGRYDTQDAYTQPPPTTAGPIHERERAREDDHTGRNAALGTGAGAAAGGAAYAAYDHSKEEEAARRAAAEHEKDLAKQREAHEKELEKQRKHEEKERERHEKEHQKELEKQHKHEQKEHEKQEKHHQKELEKQHAKEEKERAAAAAAAEKHEKARIGSEEEDRLRREREAQNGIAAGSVGTAGAVAGTGIFGHENDGTAGHPTVQTIAQGSAEQRERARIASEEEDRMRREREAQAGIAPGSFGTAGAVAGTGMFGHEKDRTASAAGPTGTTTGAGQRSSYDNSRHSHEKHPHGEKEKEKKPSFFRRIFKRRKNKDTGLDEDYSTDEEDSSHGHHGTAAAGVGAGAAAAGSSVPTHHSDTKGRTVLGSSPGNVGRTSNDRDLTTGLPYDSAKDPQAASRLGHEPGTGTGPTAGTGTGTGHNTYTIGRGTDAAPLGAGSASGVSGHNATHQDDLTSYGTTGLPHDTSRGTTGATGLDSTTGTHGTSGTGYGLPGSASEPFGVIGDHHR